MLSIIIPTLNAERHLVANLSTLMIEAQPSEIIVMDGGSADQSRKIAQDAGARVVSVEPGRGKQLAQGAKISGGDWLLFLHADTRLEEGWRAEVDAFVSDPDNRRHAAYFRFALDDDDPRARKLERVVARRCNWFGLPYGDQGLLISRSLYNIVGGYKEFPLMEDVNLVRRIGKKGLVGLETPAITSADRYCENGYRSRSLRNVTLLTLYFLGMPTAILARLYSL